MRRKYRPTTGRLPPPIASLLALCLEGGEARALREAALVVLQDAVGFDAGHFVPFTDAFFDAAPDYLVRFTQEPRYANNLRRAVIASGPDGAYVDTDVFSAHERERLPLYRDLLGPAGIASQIVSIVRSAGRVTGVIHLNRYGGSPDFAAADLARIRETLRAIALLHVGVDPVSGGDDDAARLLTRSLSPRQLDIAMHVGEGYQNAQIAARLGLSERTIKNQVSEIFVRIGSHSRAELAALCERAGMLRGEADGPRTLSHVLRSVSAVMASA